MISWFSALIVFFVYFYFVGFGLILILIRLTDFGIGLDLLGLDFGYLLVCRRILAFFTCRLWSFIVV